MKLTHDEVMNLPAKSYDSVNAIKEAIYVTYSVGISTETAKKIINDWKHEQAKADSEASK